MEPIQLDITIIHWIRNYIDSCEHAQDMNLDTPTIVAYYNGKMEALEELLRAWGGDNE